ncbi:hypothetical protein A9267_20255 [Shewanella sp. UCD-FRSSP16_17]|uniref:hypothetical protein n=1 Tax=Shewanella sp. UCD-FRSSP16_17 TaxID=1853256 RepID=UPI0007EEE8E0|nr:hypothetical protein [Shewanella sp. UCD-FRSSP16_17]OBT09911.1 hypothetical protein A9267_20255 [Shewanella sp. UCD-FRSSP16_17]
MLDRVGKAKISTEYYTVGVSNCLFDLMNEYRSLDPVLSTFDDRKLALYIVNRAIEEQIEIATDEIKLSRTKDIKLKQTRKITNHFESVNQTYKNYGVNISSRQYFHRLILSHIRNRLSEIINV